MSKDFFGDLKSKVSSLASDIMPSKDKDTTPKEDTSTPGPSATPAQGAGDTFNSDVLFALNSLNKMMGQLVSHSESSNSLTETMTRKMGSSNRFEG
jgi:hypothetical protein